MDRRNLLCLVGGSAAGLAAPGLLAAGQGDGLPAPLAGLDTFLSGFHVGKRDHTLQVETCRYCTRLSADLSQCVLFHGTGPDAKLIGVEYVISDALYRRLPLEEKRFWHPHAYEVLSGQLAAPDLPGREQDRLARGLVTTWGKAWHTWPDPSTELPEGEPVLMWAPTGDGQVDAALLAGRDGRLGVSTDKAREQRAALGLPVPQVGRPESVAEVGRQWCDDGPDTPESARRRRGGRGRA